MTDQDNTDDAETLWWGEPLDARRYHIFGGVGAMCRGLCGGWMMGYSSDMPHVDPESDSWRDGKDCKTCARKAGVLDE